MTGYSYFYPGGNYGLDPNYGFVGYRISSGDMGTSTNIQNAAQITEVTGKLNQGFKQVEVGMLNSELFAQMPKQQFKEIERLNKLTGVKASLHAPIQDIEPSGLTQEGYSEVNRMVVERKLLDVIEKAYELNPNGNTPVTVHCANMRGSIYTKKEGEEKAGLIMAVDQKTGALAGGFKEEEKYYPDERYLIKKGDQYEIEKRVDTPKQQIDVANNSKWIGEIQSIAEHKKHADEVLGNSIGTLANLILRDNELGGKIREEDLNPDEKEAFKRLEKSGLFLNNVESSFATMFNEAYKCSGEEERKVLAKIAWDLKEEKEKIIGKKFYDKNGRRIKDGSLQGEINEVAAISEYLDKATMYLANSGIVPEYYKPVEEFAKKKSAETFSNVALHSYKKFGENAPIVSIENLYPGIAYSRTEDLKELLEESRKQFIEKAIDDGMSEKEAKRVAEKVIGITWDVGHANMMKQYGYEDKDIVAGLKSISKDVKHLHLSDNFGYSDSHLVMGMGNVPTKQSLEALEKAGVLDKIMKIHEIGGVEVAFKTAAFPYMLEAFGSPISGDIGPYWNQGVSVPGNYFMGYGNIFPDRHMSMYGSGFSGLPTELGGQVGGGQSRFSGTPNA
jgi:hypothetical protein